MKTSRAEKQELAAFYGVALFEGLTGAECTPASKVIIFLHMQILATPKLPRSSFISSWAGTYSRSLWSRSFLGLPKAGFLLGNKK